LTDSTSDEQLLLHILEAIRIRLSGKGDRCLNLGKNWNFLDSLKAQGTLIKSLVVTISDETPTTDNGA
jgi:hypothetical protein